MQEVAHHGGVAEFEDHCFKVVAKAADPERFPVEPVELRRASKPGTVTLSRVPAIGAAVSIADLRHALDLVEQQAA